MGEIIIDVYWEGPFKWKELGNNIKKCHVLYAIYGNHPTYGHESLLYIGRTKKIRNRMVAHAWWVEDEYDEITARVASIGEVQTWEGWDDHDRYDDKEPHSRTVSGAEILLIYAHQPAYNQKSKSSLLSAKGLRLFNTGHIGSLLPEVSYRYHNPRGDW